MPNAPGFERDRAIVLRKLYEDIEANILATVARRLSKGIEDNDFAAQQLKQIRDLQADLDRQLDAIQDEQAKIVRDTLIKAYDEAQKEVDADFVEIRNELNIDVGTVGRATAVGMIGTSINVAAVEALATSIVADLRAQKVQILRSTADFYRSTVSSVAAQLIAGTVNRQQAIQRALNQFADQGVSGFVDKRGRRWDMASYSDMALRTAAIRASAQGTIDRMAEYGHDLVMVSDHPDECPTCRPWEGRVLSVSGNDPEHASLNEAIGAGLFHPNCGHTYAAYHAGYTRRIKPKVDPTAYEDRQRQRYNERMIRKWKKRLAVAVTEQERRKAKTQISNWQAVQRKFIAESGRRRDYNREQI